MLIIPIHTPLIHTGDNLADLLKASEEFERGDIVVVSSKVVATAESAAIHLPTLTPSDEALFFAEQTGRDAHFCEAVIQETARLHGRIIRATTGALLTEVQPDGFSGTILVPNAGLDQSNIASGYAIGWPHDPVKSVKHLSNDLGVPVIISDSCVYPRRMGVTAIALTVCGIDPISDAKGQADLFGHPLTITVEATADQLAVAANGVMGNAGQSIPAAIIRHALLPSSGFCGWVPGMHSEEDLFG